MQPPLCACAVQVYQHDLSIRETIQIFHNKHRQSSNLLLRPGWWCLQLRNCNFGKPKRISAPKHSGDKGNTMWGHMANLLDLFLSNCLFKMNGSMEIKGENTAINPYQTTICNCSPSNENGKCVKCKANTVTNLPILCHVHDCKGPVSYQRVNTPCKY